MSEPTTDTSPLYVLGVHVENFMRLAAVDLQIDPSGLTLFTGRNAQGKSSALAAIDATLAGAGAVPAQPIRAGAESGQTSVILGPDGTTPAFIVTRRYRESGTSSVEIRAADGTKVPSPQSLLSSFFDATTFNPVEFAFPPGEKTPAGRNRKRLEMLLAVAPLSIDLARHDAERGRLFTERTGVNRRVKEAEAVAKEAAASVTAPDGPIEDESEPLTALARIENAARERAAAAQRATQLRAEIEETEKQIALLQAKVERLAAECLAAGQASLAPEPDAAPVRARLEEIRARNEARRRSEADRVRAEERARALLAARREAEALDAKIADMDRIRDEAIAAARFPVKSLTILNDGTVAVRLKTGQTVPVEQCSTAQKILLSFAIGASRKPRLRTALIHDGNDLDGESLAALARMAKEKGYQLIAERILPDSAGVSIVFEDGEAKS